ncbi:MAG: magnesium transporter CorA family protein [Planctomycetaceae bacterium]|nr:magnesium transporter CorA family protein [Planctomycetaceae bacterium]
MRANYDIIDGRLVPTEDENSKIQVFVDPDETERLYLIGELNLDEHTLASALDPDELSRIEFEPDHAAIIFKQPRHYSSNDNFLFRVSSVGLYLFKDRLIAVLSDDVSLFDRGKDMSSIVGGLPELLIRLLTRSVSQFLSHIRTISMIVSELEQKLAKTMSNEHLLHLFQLSQSMTYYLSAISANGALFNRLRGYSAKIGFTVEHNELLEDLSVDNAQCHKQAEIYSDVLANLMDARAAVVNNNLNLLMKRLTIFSLIFLPLNVIASVFGMSEYSEFVSAFIKGEGSPFDYPYLQLLAYSLFFVGLVVLGYLTYRLLRRVG